MNKWSLFILAEIYTSEKDGSDETGSGTQDQPFKTILKVTSAHVIEMAIHL